MSKRGNAIGSVIPITGTNVAAPVNSGTEWSLMALGDLANCVLHGTSIEETAEFLCRDVTPEFKVHRGFEQRPGFFIGGADDVIHPELWLNALSLQREFTGMPGAWNTPTRDKNLI